jgi:hypothetical protein
MIFVVHCFPSNSVFPLLTDVARGLEFYSVNILCWPAAFLYWRFDLTYTKQFVLKFRLRLAEQ